MERTTLGSYRLVRRIGDGGMGEVWLAEHALLGRLAAIKVLHPMYSDSPDATTRFFNEARATTAIADPGIVHIYDYDLATDGSAYIVMELLEGETLDARLERCGSLPLLDALRIIRQVASALGAAHARGIVHRDLKPENIFLVRDAEVPGGERAKILDFGIAKLAHAPRQTLASALMGTPLYMSPEQCRGDGDVDARADIYSLGCVLYRLLVGAPAFDADDLGELIGMHLDAKAPRASSGRADIPLEIDDLISRCLDKDPAQRFANGTELATFLGGLLARGLVPPPRASRSTKRLTVRAPQQPTLAMRPLAMRPTPTRTHGFVIGLLATCVLTLVLALAHAPASHPNTALHTEQR